MYGSFLGDILGQPYEFDRGPRNKNFEMFVPGCYFTDDSLLTTAIAEGLMDIKDKIKKGEITDGPGRKKAILDYLTARVKNWCKRKEYDRMNNEYGTNFSLWLDGKPDPKWESKGNGSAMRVGSAGWLFDSLEETIEFAGYTAEISHRHSEGIKGAQAVAAVIYLARTGKSKEEIKDFVQRRFGYKLNMTVADLQKTYCDTGSQSEVCDTCVPQAIVCFLESENYEDAVKNAISIGGDTDTIGCITGSMAEAMYGVPAKLKAKCDEYLDSNIRSVTDRFLKLKNNYKEPSDKLFAFDENMVMTPFQAMQVMKKSAELDYAFLKERLEEQEGISGSHETKKFCGLFIKGIDAGYSVDDLLALYEVRRALDIPAENDSPKAAQAKAKCESLLSDIFENKKNGTARRLTVSDRIKNLQDMAEALDEYSKEIGSGMNKCRSYINDIALPALLKRETAGLTPAEKVRLATSTKEAYHLLDMVDPSGMMSSKQFKDMKAAFERFLELERNTDFKDQESVTRYNESRKDLLTLADQYLKYKDQQNRGFHKRSKAEYHRVDVVNALVSRLKKNDFSRDTATLTNEAADKLIHNSRKSLWEGKEVKESALILYGAKQLKDAGVNITPVSLKNKCRDILRDNTAKTVFKETVCDFKPAEIEDMINNGRFEEKLAEHRKTAEYARIRKPLSQKLLEVNAAKLLIHYGIPMKKGQKVTPKLREEYRLKLPLLQAEAEAIQAGNKPEPVAAAGANKTSEKTGEAARNKSTTVPNKGTAPKIKITK